MESKSIESGYQASNGLKRPAQWLIVLLFLALGGSACDLSASAFGPGAAVLAPGAARVVSNGTACGARVETSTRTPSLSAARAGSVANELVVGQQALQQISYDWETKLPGWTIEFLPGRTGLLGGTWPSSKKIEVYVRDGQSVADVAFTLAHEIGHAVDVSYNTDQDRAEWREARGIGSSYPWWVDCGKRDFEVGAGDFAESFAVWQVGQYSGVESHALWGDPTAAEMELMAHLAS